MNKIILLYFMLLTPIVFAQEIEEVNYELPRTEENVDIPFAVVETPPIYEGCQELNGNTAKKNCFSQLIAKHVSKKFNVNISDSLGLPSGRIKINTMFKVNKKGEIVDVKARAPHPKLEEEAIRVIQLIPKMYAPAMHMGRPTGTNYSFPIVFNVVGTMTPTDTIANKKRIIKKEK
ncbi:energy transducer TonB [Olleya sp. HaHaR_3_96]|uniref:energy transducer TonB n=1 Tax=Olleya sp. HaHaR_3_96 TaxID=2745560 RepID=UPI001C4EBE9D|nr:energy transducer TonB [Olleya sp. HaHaR_3_96]QXP61256.1 energy transducer TonB [Olleya sp. HaHaR_3_96]